jgi:subtilisin family serine protease
MSRSFGVILLLFLLSTAGIYAQQHRFMVFFQDKSNNYSIENPQEFLSQRAIDRRLKQGILVSTEDLPVNREYVSELESLGVTVHYTTKWLNGALIETDSTKLAEITALTFVSSLEMVAPGALRPSAGKLNKTNQLEQGRTQSTEVQNRLLGVDLMQQEGLTGDGLQIAIFDGGFQGVDQITAFEHLFQNNQMVATYDFVGNSEDAYRYDDHGTKVLSVIAANSPGVFVGSAYDAQIVLCVTEDVTGEYRVEEYNWLFAAEMADSMGVDIINTSLGYSEFDDPNMNYNLQQLDGVTAIISKAATIAAGKGMVLTVSAGNEGNSSWGRVTAPADADDILAVGAINQDSIKASFSSTGPTADGRTKPDVVALGVRTSVINRNGNIVFNNGTSFSAPQIAGLAAGIWQANPDYSYLEVIQAIRDAGHQMLAVNNQTGYGIPHYEATRELVLATTSAEKQAFLKLYPNPVNNQLFLYTELPLSAITLFIHNIQGQKYLERRLENLRASTEISLDLPLLPGGIYLLTALTEDTAGTYRLIKE